VLDAATADPLSDSQLEQVVRLALGKRVPIAVKTDKAVVAGMRRLGPLERQLSSLAFTSPSGGWGPRTKVLKVSRAFGIPQITFVFH
jgi:hypothetical protein